MTDPHLPHPHDPVVESFGGLGTPVDCTGLRSLTLEGPHILWLVEAGATDLFAVDAERAGPWHHLGRLERGALLLGPADGPRHTLVARPAQGCRLRRIELRELQWSPQDAWTWHATGEPGPLEQAFALGAGRGLHVLCQAPDDVLWMQVAPGSVRYGAAYEGYADGTLLVDATLWQGMTEQQHRLLYAVDRWIEELERDHEDRAAAGIAAGEAARAGADRTLLAAIDGPRRRARHTAAGADATYAACRLVAEAARITLREPADTPTAGPDPVERIALASRIRTRTVRLAGAWWREDTGPLLGHRDDDGAPVALLWRRGGYEAVDPATGRRERIGRDNHADYAPRAVMFYRPLPDGTLTLRTLLRFGLRGTGRELRGIALGVLVAVGLGTLVPVATGKVLGTYVPRAETGLIVQTGVALAAVAALSAVFMLLQNVSVLRLEGRIEATLQPAVWDRLLRLPAAFFADRSTGELAGAAMGISAIRRTVSGIAPVVLQAGTLGAVNLVLLLVYSVPLALAALAMLVLVAGVLLGLGWWQLRHQRRLVVLGHQLDNRAFQTLRGLPKLRVAAAESFAYAAWAKEFARTRDLQQRIGRLKNTVTILNAVCLPLCTLVLFMLLAGPAQGTLTAGDFLTFSTSVTLLFSSVTQLTGALLSAAAVQPLYEQLRPILRAVPETRSGDAPPGELTGALEARDLSFRYADDGPLVLDGVSFRVRPGEFVAVVGASGCGKSTLLRLLIGLDTPLSGTVLYDGQDLSALDRSAVRRQCGVVLQNAQPFAGSILECISGAESYPLEEVWQAAAAAGLADDIKAMPMGLHTMLSDGGGTVSGGQRQRLMIAQALVRKPRLLFLDEATSALDNEAQRIVIESTRALHATRIVIAHRLSTVMDADRVLVMAEGRIVQEGPPAELLADTGGLFHELVRRQMG
ncbi:NHLP family bacteriocin export ABC transporter permease/ATPase subunit [Streptomyces mashuensis]|uniref:NHLP family bacteriocin export ABC transporter permease/ATPase subunit n=1 Tax=Streptomyces mashuensis TaxID=33904 RepID=A0A919EE38_9ACTN|nr:NHLP bacteriocin export ABC transporter permease/ATPase subunit [Streptomyces mashuensis]GHF53422.1 NHLP family bacteriocin export ABC transporter permease/ATPase subunit [Streptomyces mashuensis]